MPLKQFITSFFSQKRIAGGAAVLALTQFGASFAGLIRDRVLASTFPPGIDQLDVVSVYISAFRPSDLLFQMFVMSAFSVALVPLLASHLAHGREEEMNRLLSSVLVVASGAFGIIALLLGIFMRELAPLFVQFDGASLELYIRFARYACLTNAFFVIGNAFGQLLIVRQTYWAYGLAPIIYTLGTILGALFLTPVYGPLGPMIGTVIGAVVYVLLRFGASVRQGFSFALPRGVVLHPEIREMGILMLPRMAALGAVQFQLLFFDRIASGLDLGAVTVNAYARNFQSVVVGVVGIALAQSCYSLLAQSAARGDHARFAGTLKKGSLLTIGLTILGAVVLVACAPVAAKLVHLTEVDILHAFLIVLTLYAISIPFESLNHLLFRAMYARKNTTLPAIITFLSGAVSVLLAFMLFPRFGLFALPIGFAAGQIVATGMLGGAVWRG